jgi:NTP pyrophosphatase (non-canonical NTP hydrolase)
MDPAHRDQRRETSEAAMNIDDYARWACTSGPQETTAESADAHLAILGLSLLGDAAEVGEIVKKRLRDGELDRARLAHELGDVIYYWARLCAVAGVAPSAVLEQSRRHIEARLAKRAQGRP